MKYAITGYGLTSSLGIGRKPWEAALAAGKNGFRKESQNLRESIAAQVPETAEVWDFDAKQWLGPKGHRNCDRLTKLMITAGRLALEDAGVKKDGEFKAYSPEQVGISSATAYGSLEAITELNRVSELEDPRYINPARFPNTVINAAAGYVSIWEDLQAPNVTTVDGNCGSLDAVLTAATHLWGKRGDAFVVGGADVVSEPLALAFAKFGAFDSNLRLGEGAAYLMMERTAAARERGASICGFVRGYGSSFASREASAMLLWADARAVQRALELALADAKLNAEDLDLLISSESGLELFDRAERNAIDGFLPKDIRVLKPKREVGETLGAAGAFGMARALAAFSEDSSLRHAAIITQGFYGNVSVVVLSSSADESDE